MIIKKNISNIFLIFLLSHTLIWTFVPSLTNINLPLDTIEALAWGSNLQWGFSKHPPLSAFAVEIIFQFFRNQDWAYYLLSQLFVILSFYIIFKFAEDFLNNQKLAFLSVLLLEGIYFYNYTSPEFNVNVCQLPFWAASIYFTWKCISYEKKVDFFFLGIVLGLGVLSKYLFIYLLLGIKFLFIYLIINRKKINLLNYFIAGPIFLIILSPHIFWLVENNFSTIFYGFQRTGGIGNYFEHLSNPLIFIIKQIGILLPFAVMSYFLTKNLKFKFNFKDKKLIFLIFVVIVPLLLVLLTSIILGAKIRTMWMTPFYLFLGVFFIYIFQNYISLKKLKTFYLVFMFIFLLSPTIYIAVSVSNDNKRTDYPGKEIARLVQEKWDKNFINEIKHVVGDEWYAGNLSYHLNSRPKWYQSLQDKTSKIGNNDGVIYTGNPKVLEKICPGVFGTIRPVGYCMIGQK